MELKNFKSKEIAVEYERLYNKTMELWPDGYKGYYIDTSYGKTWIHEIGDGSKPVLLLLHGMSGSSTLWYPNVKHLAENYRVITPDIIGQAGKSILEKPLYSPVDLDKWLDEVVIALNIKKLFLGGISFGGWLAARYTLFAPEKVEKLIMMDPAGVLAPLRFYFYFRLFAMLLIPLPSIGDSFVNWMGQGYEMNEDFLNQMEVGIKDYKNIKGQKNIYANKISDKDLQSIKIPVLLMCGDRSVVYNGNKAMKRANAMISQVKIELIPHCCHAINMEQSEIVDRLITDFIKLR